jgi:small redox-active disulfide protein 2
MRDRSISVKVLGVGCEDCERVEALVREAAAEGNIDASVEHVRDYQSILTYGVMSTPGVVVEGKVRSAGRVPAKAEIAMWLAKAAEGKA